MDDVDLDLVSADEKPRLSEVLDFESEIAPYPLTMIYAGLGSGKNTFAGFLMNGSKEYNLPKLNVLLITSRKAKVVETLSDKELDIGSGMGDKKNLEEILKGYPLGLDVYRREIEEDPRGWGVSSSAVRHALMPLLRSTTNMFMIPTIHPPTCGTVLTSLSWTRYMPW